MLNDAKAMGLPPPPEEFKPKPENTHYEVWPENWPTVELFLRCQTQWRTGINGIIGLDYGAVLEVGRLYNYQDMPDVLASVQIMEHAILSEVKP